MTFYSIRLWTPVEIDVPKHYLALDPGSNTFNILVEDIEGFLAGLRAKGARIDAVNNLDALEPLPAHMIDPQVLPTGGPALPQLEVYPHADPSDPS